MERPSGGTYSTAMYKQLLLYNANRVTLAHTKQPICYLTNDKVTPPKSRLHINPSLPTVTCSETCLSVEGSKLQDGPCAEPEAKFGKQRKSLTQRRLAAVDRASSR